MTTPFSRLQLAAALIEYDNDDSNPNAPKRRAEDSAIFAHLRRHLPRSATAARKSTDYLGVSLPSEGGSGSGRESVTDNRKSRGSIDALKNPFGRDSTYDGHMEGEDEAEQDVEVDLSSWGLDAFIPKDKDSKKKKGKDTLPNPHPVTRDVSVAKRRAVSGKAMSLGNIDMFGEGGAFLEASSSVDNLQRRPTQRRHSIGTALDFGGSGSMDRMPSGRPMSSHALIENLPVGAPLHSVPFPTLASVRSTSPGPQEAVRSSSRASLLNPHDGNRPSSRASLLNPQTHGRTFSTASLGSKMLAETPEEDSDNPFAVRPPSPGRASRFDPKARSRTMSNTTRDLRARTVSVGSLGTQMLLNDGDGAASTFSRGPERERRYSRLELMRPKVLVMPSPLQPTMMNQSKSTPTISRDGFLLSNAPPLPPGAKSATRKSALISALEPVPVTEAPIASNSFTPNPRMSLSLSQLTFRNTLAVDGQRDVAYVDIDNRLQRATRDGEQAFLPEPETSPEPTPAPPIPEVVVEEDVPNGRPPGKLFGKSLIDDLEARKAEMKGKQRVFTGDQRPSMMARSPMKRSSTLIDPESLKGRPLSQRMDSAPGLIRRNSANVKTLINFEDEIPGAPRGLGVSQGPAQTKSVFGVDTIWERELAKLREIEAREKQEEEERKRREAEEEAKGGSKKKKKGKGKGKDKDKDLKDFLSASSPAPEASPSPSSVTHERQPTPPPVLPDIQKASTKRRPPPPPDDGDDDDEESEDDASDASGPARRPSQTQEDGWVSSDEERERAKAKVQAGPIRMPGSGPRYPSQNPKAAPQLSIAGIPDGDDSSEEDVPLVATIGRAAQRLTQMKMQNDDESSSDEEKPLSTLLEKTKLKLPSLGGSIMSDANSPRAANDDEDEDDQPLGLRASRFIGAPASLNGHAGVTPRVGGSGADDDDKPLAFHPEQVRRTQYMMNVQQQQQQQQQMMMQAQAAQMHQSMIFGVPSMMSSGFFGPPMQPPPPMMVPPVLPATPPPIQDPAKFGRVDKWRRDVAVEGQAPS
ncbi:hypothetical protein K474DRAFT_1769128 [Panus rudis PR-1116 ss-1]|nr:hypothetical protein K474DRAFT_1769128 [Panus rudis PR-1116 ss-1]